MKVKLTKDLELNLPKRSPIIAAIIVLALYNLYMVQQIPRKLARQRVGPNGLPSHEDFLGSFDINDLPTLTLPEGRGVPSVCQRAETECKRVFYCNKRKWQSIPSCHRAAKRCSEMPITEQITMGFCEPCVDMGRSIHVCKQEILQCLQTRDICFKVRKKVRENTCESSKEYIGSKWSVAAVKEFLNTDPDRITATCLDAGRAEIEAFNQYHKAEALAYSKHELEAREKAAIAQRKERQAALQANVKTSPSSGKHHDPSQQLHFSGLDGAAPKGSSKKYVPDPDEYVEKISYPKLDLDMNP